MSKISTPPSRPIEELAIPTMFLEPIRDRAMAIDYLQDLYGRLPANIKKKFFKVDDGHYWMLSHPGAASRVIWDRFDETL